MEDYVSEEQRVEALKKWWQTNASSIVWGLVLGLAILSGWNFWQSSQQRKAEEASGLYEQLLKNVDDKKVEPAVKLSERIIEKYQGTAYATYAALFAAKLKAESNDLAGAKKVLEDLLATTKDDDIKHLVRLRLGEVLSALGDNDAALKLLFLALRAAAKKWTMPIHDWPAALNYFTVLWPDRMPALRRS